jgi:hypothetical protein
VEEFVVRISREMAEIAKVNTKRKGRVDPNNPKERASNGRSKARVNLDSLDDQASNGHPKIRSTKVSTTSGHGFFVETVDEDISIGDKDDDRDDEASDTKLVAIAAEERTQWQCNVCQCLANGIAI